MKIPKFLNFIRKPVPVGLLMFFFLLSLTQFLSYERYLLLRETETRELNNEAYSVKERLQTVLSYNLSTAQTLGFIAQKYGVPRDFDSVGATLLRSNKFIDAVQLVEGGVITHVFPLKGNEAVIGYNILKDSLRNSGALTAIKTKKFFWAGPLELKQGGVGIIGRQPLFRNNKFKGFAAVIIRLPTFLNAIGIDSNSTNGFYYQLSRINEANRSEVFFLPNQELQNAVVASVEIPNSEWKLYVGTENNRTLFFTITFSVLGFILSVLGGLFVWHFVRQPEHLNKLVEEKAKQLSEVFKERETVLNRITDAVLSLDNESRITFINQTAQYRLSQEKGQPVHEHEIIGRKVWDVYKGVKETVFWEKYQQAAQTQKEVEAEGFFSPTNRWLFTKMYPSSDGVTLYSRDVSESKRAEQEILLEKNFSDSIINSLPGVFYLYDRSGRFLRWNKNFETISGYSAEEIGSDSPPDFFDVDEKKVVLAKIKEALQTGAADAEVQFFTKDKLKIPYYFNGHIANFNGRDYLIGMGIDITERKKAEKETELEKNLSESVINSLPGIFYLSDLNGKLLRWNKNLEEVSGYSAEELNAMYVIQFVDTDDQQNILARRQEAIEKGVSEVEINFLTKQKQNLPYYFTSLLSMYNNQPCLLGVGLDIAERKKAEEQVTKNEQKYRSLIEQASDPIMVTDFEGNFVDVNTSLCSTFGYTKEELLKLNIRALIDPQQLKERPMKFDLLAAGQHVFSDRLMVRKDGSNVEVEANVKKVDDNYVMAIARDVTQLRQAQREIKINEARFRGAFEYSPIGMAITTLEGKWIKVNRELCNITGYSEEELLRLSFPEITHPDDLPRDLQFIKQVLAGEVDSFNSEKRYFHKSGAIVWVHLSVSIVKDPQGVPLYFVAQIENINEQKKAKEDLKESEERYRALVENATEALVVLDLEKGQFVSVSKSAEELFRMSKEELLEVGPIEVSPEYQPNGLLSSEMAMKLLNEAVEGGKPHFEWTHCDKNGNPIPCEIWLVRLPSENQILIRGSILDITERKQSEKEKEYARYLLNERVKELTTLYKTGRILQTEQSKTEIVLQEIVDILPSGWQYPEICEARITLGKQEFKTHGYTASTYSQGAEFNTMYNLAGTVEVIYLEEKSTQAEGPFLTEERNLIDMLAEMIRIYLNQKYEAEELNSSYVQLRQLSSHLQTIREEERTGIAREIHDELGQQLTALKMDASWLTKKISPQEKPLHEKLSGMTALIDDTVKTVRRISSDLRPGILDDLGLIAALEWQSNEFGKRTGVRCEFKSPVGEIQFERSLATGVFRIYQETLTNVMRHAGATLVEATLDGKDNQVALTIRDNGRGFDKTKTADKKTLGLVGMKERALMFGGELDIESGKGKGTTVTLKIPINLFNTKPA